MGLEDITRKAQDFLKDNKVKDALESEKAEDVSDKLLGGVAEAVTKVTGGKFEDKIEQARKVPTRRSATSSRIPGAPGRPLGCGAATSRVRVPGVR